MANRTTVNVSLPLEMGHFIDQCVKSGRISSASEVVRAGLRLLRCCLHKRTRSSSPSAQPTLPAEPLRDRHSTFSAH